MSSGLLNTGLSGLLTSQAALRTAGHNIANVSTPGYNRQKVELGARAAQGSCSGFIGSGVDLQTVQRQLSTFIVSEIRTTTSGLKASETFHELSARIDNMLADPAGGLSPSLQQFFDGWHGVAADPSSVPARQVLMSDAEGLVQRFHSLAERLDTLRADVDQRLVSLAGEANALAAGIAQVNERIIRDQGEFSGNPANDLLDQRDELVRELAELFDVNTLVQSNGAMNVTIGRGQALVTGSSSGTLSTMPNPFDPSVSDLSFEIGGAASNITNLVSGGEIGGALRFRREVLTEAEHGLGQVAVGLAMTLNEQHRAGQTLNGALGGELFAALDQTAPAFFANTSNTGAPSAALSISVTDPAELEPSAYLLEREGGVHRLTRLSDNTVTTLATFPAGAEEVDGLRLSLGSGAIADGDSFLIEPTRFAARGFALTATQPEDLAAATPVRATASLNNLGTGEVGELSVNLPSNELTITFDTPATTFDVVDATTGATLLTDVNYVAGSPITVNGLTTSISGAPGPGDVFTVSNAVSSAAPGNAGTGTIALTSTTMPDPNLRDAVTLTFTSANTFNVTGATTGSPTTAVAFTAGSPISFNGWTLSINGSPQTGDVFTIGPNTNGIGDNRNAMALAGKQTTALLDGERSTYEEVYGQLVASVGTVTRQADLDQSARGTLLDQVVAQRDGLSGVNLDEEAASLLRFQQTFQASAQLISVADELFQSLIAAVGR